MSAQIGAWRGELTALGALLRLDALDTGPSLDAQLDLRATDATPFLHLFFADKIPGIAADLLTMPGLHAAATVPTQPGGPAPASRTFRPRRDLPCEKAGKPHPAPHNPHIERSLG